MRHSWILSLASFRFSKKRLSHALMWKLFFLSQYWTDIYLSWNPEHYPGVQNLRFPSDQIWTPDILLYNRSELVSAPPQSLTKVERILCLSSVDKRGVSSWQHRPKNTFWTTFSCCIFIHSQHIRLCPVSDIPYIPYGFRIKGLKCES